MAVRSDDSTRFHDSYGRLDQYPTNLIYKGTYLPILGEAQAYLNEAAADLFTTDPLLVKLPFREFDAAGTAQPRNIYDDDMLKTHLGDNSFVDQLTGVLQGDVLTREDPPCRFVFPNSGHNRASLRLTTRMFQRLMTFHQIMPEYLDFVSVFGRQERPRCLRYGGFHEATHFSDPVRSPQLPIAGRSGRQFSVCFNLKAPHQDESTRLWTIRHAAVYHSFDVVSGKTLWIMTKGDDGLKTLVQAVTGDCARPSDCDYSSPESSFRSGLVIYLMLAHWATDSWRKYIEKHEIRMEDETRTATAVSQKHSRGGLPFDTDLFHQLHVLQDRLNEAAVVMNLNTSVLISVRKYLEALPAANDLPMNRAQLKASLHEFMPQMNNVIHKLESHAARTNSLVQRISDRKNLVTDRMQTHATQTMESLTKKMHVMGILSQKEAVAMRIITVVTLFYLPATFVSTFYSTDVVKYQSDSLGASNNVTSFSSLAFERWIEVTVPLTILTMVVAVCFYQRELKRRTDVLLPLYQTSGP